MDLPQEIEIWHVIPLIRKLLVKDLKDRDLKQKDIACLLNLTGSAVSQYLKEKRAKTCNLVIPEDVQQSIHSSADQIIKNKGDPKETVKIINNLCKLFREKRLICKIHMLKDANLKDCDVCYEK